MAKNKPINPELLSEYHTLAMRADRRMLRLERLAASDEDYEGVLTFAYKGAQAAARRWGSKSEKARFDIKAPESEADIKMKIKDIRSFLESDTSMKSSINTVYKKRADTFNKLFAKKDKKGVEGENVTWRDLKDFYTSKKYEELDKRFGSKTIARALSIQKKIKKNQEKEDADKKESIRDEILDSIKDKKALLKAVKAMEDIEENGKTESLVNDLQKGNLKKTRKKKK